MSSRPSFVRPSSFSSLLSSLPSVCRQRAGWRYANRKGCNQTSRKRTKLTVISLFRSAAGGEPDDYELYNSELAELAKKGEDKWFTAPWLFAECVRLSLLGASFCCSGHSTLAED